MLLKASGLTPMLGLGENVNFSISYLDACINKNDIVSGVLSQDSGPTQK